MSIEQQALFFFSGLGAFNGLFLSLYFFFGSPEKGWPRFFLGGLLFVLSLRIVKSVFFHFSPGLSSGFIQLGLSACLLIGPFLFYYLRSMQRADERHLRTWWRHLILWLTTISIFGWFYPYFEYRRIWSPYIVRGIYLQWLGYILWSGYLLRHEFTQLWRRQPLAETSVWQLNIFVGVALIWLAYFTSSFTSYIVGALSFSFVFYVSVLLWVFRKGPFLLRPAPEIPYANSSLTNEVARLEMSRLETAMQVEKYFLDPDLTLRKLAVKLEMSSKELSQVINQQQGINYSRYVAKLRVREAQRLLLDPDYGHWKISAIAYESGFNSISAFNAAFRRETGQTAKQYREKTRPES